MAPQDWWHVLRKIGLHTLNNGAAILSFILLAWLTRWGIPDGLLGTILDRIGGVVLIVLVLVFACQVIYDVLPESVRNVLIALLEKSRGLFTYKFVFA